MKREEEDRGGGVRRGGVVGDGEWGKNWEV